jgi:ketosteroid isomerase-like protein
MSRCASLRCENRKEAGEFEMHKNAELIQRFYTALQNKDAAGMQACYHKNVHFYDPAFRDLNGDRARAMWAMLCRNGKDLRVEFRDVNADDQNGAAHWDAYYTFSATGKKVHNSIDARFEFRDGLIVRHIDTFDFHRWAGQALGLVGRLLGGTSFLQNTFSGKANKLLDTYIASNR